MVILGGRGNNRGALIGAAIISLIGWSSSALNIYLSGLVVDPNYIRWMLMGAIMVLILLYRPKGLLPEKPVYTEAWSLYETKEERKALQKAGTAVKRVFFWLAGRSNK